MYLSEQNTRTFQRAVNDRGGREGRNVKVVVDGIYGPKTEAASIRLGYLLGIHPYKGSKGARQRRELVIMEPRRRTAAEKRRAKNRKKVDTGRPRFIVQKFDADFARSGLGGRIVKWTGHYTYGPRDTSLAHAKALNASYNRSHRAQYGSGIGYNLNVTADGVLIGLRPIKFRGVHVANGNTGNLGVVVHGKTGRMTDPQRRALERYLRESDQSWVPAAFRTDRPLADMRGYLHRELTPTSCPGSFATDYLRLAGRR